MGDFRWRAKRRLRPVTTACVAVGAGLILVAGLTVPALTWTAQPLPRSFFPPHTELYVDPESPAAAWVREHHDDTRAAVIGSHLARQPQATWFSNADPTSLSHEVDRVVEGAAAQRAVPVLVAYAIPDRDCGGASSGGTGDLASYRAWIDTLATGLGNITSIVILEPDALANISCLAPHEQRDRFAALAYAAQSLHRHDPHVRVYYDAGNSAWQSPATMAALLAQAGINQNGDGIALNVSNFNNTNDEIGYGRGILRRLTRSGLTMVVDTSRNGRGAAPGHQTCDPPGRAVGPAPTADTRVSGVDAFLWIKHPGQADGCLASAGVFVPDDAYHLVGG